MANMNVEEKVFQLPIDIVEAGKITKTLVTADTYVDKNIKIEITTPDATYEVEKAASVTATVSTTDTIYTSETETAYPIVIAADAEASAVSVGVKDAGFADASDSIEVEGASAAQNTKTIYVKEGHLTGSAEAKIESTGDKEVKLTKGGAGDFIIKASSAGSVKVDTAGWLPANASADASSEVSYSVQKASLANTGSADATEITAPVLTEGGYLYINEGYIKDTKISLATLIPDDAVIPGVAEGKSDLMYNTVAAYDSDGKLIAGTMGDAELSAITASDASAEIGTVTITANDNASAFKVTGSADISGNASASVITRGLATTDMETSGEIEGTATVNATLAKIGLAIDTPEAITVTPVIAQGSSTAKTGAIATEAPATGKYIVVSADAVAASATVTPKVASEGYGTTGVYSATGATVIAGSAASGNYYIPVTAGSHSATMSEPTIVNATAVVATAAEATSGFEGNLAAGILSAAPSGQYITITADATPTKGSVSGNVTCTATEGYIEASQETKTVAGDVDVNVTAAAAKYIRVYDGSML